MRGSPTSSTRRGRRARRSLRSRTSTKGWMLKINYTKLPNGGSCAKTCHETKAYNNKTLTSSAPK